MAAPYMNEWIDGYKKDRQQEEEEFLLYLIENLFHFHLLLFSVRFPSLFFPIEMFSHSIFAYLIRFRCK